LLEGGQKGPRDIRRKIQLAFRRLTPTEKGDLGYAQKVAHRTYEWCLTPAGIEEAARLMQAQDPAWVMPGTMCLTARWLDEKLQAGLRDKLISKLSRTLARSSQMNEIEDLVDGWFIDAISSDRLRKRIEEGRAPATSTLAEWIKRRASSKFRDAARDAHGRHFRGARTAKERNRGDDEAEHQANLHAMVIDISVPAENTPVYFNDTEGPASQAPVSFNGGTPVKDFADSFDLEEYVQHKLDREKGLSQMEASVRFNKSGAPDRYVGVLEMMRDGLKISEIAKKEGCGNNRAATLTADTRRALRKGVEDIQFAVGMMGYIEEEPWATLDDLEEDLDLDDFDRTPRDLRKALTRLVKLGIFEVRFSGTGKSPIGCYRLTQHGSAILNEHHMGILPLRNRFIL
jgi:hypothetical protein